MKLLENKIFIKGISVLALAAMLTGFLPPVALADNEQESCDHQWKSETTTAASCVDGVETYTCEKCGTSYTTAIPAVSQHTYTSDYASDNNATCTENGTQSRICSVCGTVDRIPLENSALGHSLQDMPARAATCSQPGFKAPCKYCPRCGKCFTLNDQGQLIEMKDNVIPMLPHSWNEGEVTTAASCLVTGVKTYTCTVCNQTYTEETPFGDHSWDEGTITTEPTCTATGVKTFTCSVCKTTKTEELPALGHTWNDGEVTKEASCKAVGEKTYTCSICKATKTEEIPMLAHIWDEGTVTTEASCVDGVKTYTCSECGDTYTEAIAADAEHTWNDGKVTQEPTCLAKGVKTYTCSVCKATKTEEIPIVDHSWDEGKVTTEASCTAAGEKTYTCSVCKTTKNEGLPALGHTWNDGEVTKEAGCTEKGEKTYTCSVCKATKTEEIPALGHSMEYDKEEELYYCKNCKMYYQDEAGEKTLAAANEGIMLLGTEAEANTTTNISNEFKAPKGLDSSYTEEAFLASLMSSVNATYGTSSNVQTFVYDISFTTTVNGAAVAVTDDNFPAEGLSFTLPYPSGMTADGYNYVLLHLKHDGSTENIPVNAGASGLSGTVTSASPFALAAIPAALTGTVTITEDAATEVLTATVTDSNNTGTLSYQWYCDGSLVIEATSSTYTLKTEDNAKKFTCEVSSSVQTGTIKSKDYTAITAPAAPTDLGTTPELDNGKNGTITGVSAAMEYSTSVTGTYIACTGTTVTGLPAGTYYVRVKAADPRPAGKTTIVEVKSTYSITPSIAYGYGSISPSSKVILNKGDSQTFTFTPNANYYIYGVYVDGTYVGYASSYTFTNVTAPHTISVKFYYGNNPKTGDDAALALWAAGAVLSLAGATALTMTYKKKKNKG